MTQQVERAAAPQVGPAAHGFDEVTILWISEGMSCDGDTVAMTAAGQPAIEDVVLGLVPGLPKVKPARVCTLWRVAWVAEWSGPRVRSWSARRRRNTRSA